MDTNFKVLETINNEEYIFNSQYFSAEYKRVARYNVEKGDYVKRSLFMTDFANAIGVSESAVKQWLSGRTGVSHMERVIDIAEFLGIKDYKKLLVKKESENVTMINVEERKAAKEVFEMMTEYIIMFRNTDGFMGIGEEYCRKTDAGWYSFEEVVEKVVKKSRFELPKSVYEKVDALYQEISYTFGDELTESNDGDRVRELDRVTEEFYAKLHDSMQIYLK